MSRFRSTDTRSSSFETDGEKLRFVRRYFRLFTEVRAAEFEVKYQATASGDTYDMRAVFLVDPSACDQWLAPGDSVTVDCTEIVAWFRDVVPADDRWRWASVPVIRQRPDGHAVTVAFLSEGIILKRVREPTLPWLAEVEPRVE